MTATEASRPNHNGAQPDHQVSNGHPTPDATIAPLDRPLRESDHRLFIAGVSGGVGASRLTYVIANNSSRWKGVQATEITRNQATFETSSTHGYPRILVTTATADGVIAAHTALEDDARLAIVALVEDGHRPRNPPIVRQGAAAMVELAPVIKLPFVMAWRWNPAQQPTKRYLRAVDQLISISKQMAKDFGHDQREEQQDA